MTASRFAPLAYLGAALSLTTLSLTAPGTATPAFAQSPPPPAGTSTAFTLTTGTPRTPEQLAMRFDKADLAFKVNPENRDLAGDATLEFTATAPLSRLVLEFDTVFQVIFVNVNGELIVPGDWRNPDGRMTIDLREPLAAGDKAVVRIAYQGQPHQAKNAPWDGGFVWARTTDNKPWIATAVQGEGCDLFWPCIDHPEGEPARADLHITIPSDLSAPSNGRFLGKTDHSDGTTTWNWTAAHPDTYAIALNIGPYVEMTADYHSRFGNVVPLHFWRLASDRQDRAEALFAEFPKMLDFYESEVGPFPFGDEKMGVVETPHLGMEHQTINAYGNAYKLDGKGYDWLLQHELAHEWFGNQMTNVTWDDMWLHEGLGTYMQPLYARWLNGDRYMEAELATMRLALHNTFPLVSGKPQDSATVYTDATGPGLDLYYKGALVAHSLRTLIGDEAFKRSLTRLVYGRPDPRPGNFEPLYASTPDFIRIVNEESHRDLGWFFATYVYQAALPKLVLTRDGDRATVTWADTAGSFPMPVEVEVDGQLRTLPMRDGKGDFTAPEGAHIILDPSNKLLRQLDFIDAYQARQREDAGPARPQH
ncbi:MAG: M1 family peptidase [Caulobacteraceae bacterium]|nr:M1 family peptidase [Caulobacteraceae bacterium]